MPAGAKLFDKSCDEKYFPWFLNTPTHRAICCKLRRHAGFNVVLTITSQRETSATGI